MNLEFTVNYYDYVSRKLIKTQIRDTTIPIPREGETVIMDDVEYVVINIQHNYSDKELILKIYLSGAFGVGK